MGDIPCSGNKYPDCDTNGNRHFNTFSDGDVNTNSHTNSHTPNFRLRPIDFLAHYFELIGVAA